MTRSIRVLALSFGMALAVIPGGAPAQIGPGITELPAGQPNASGHFSDDDVKLTVAYATALKVDNVDGEGDDDVKMRVVLADKPVPAEALMGGSFPPVWAMAKAGLVRGVMLEFDPADRTQLTAVILAKPTEEGASLATVSMSNSEGLWKSLAVSVGHVGGHLVNDQFTHADLTFDAPLATNAVVSDLKGPAAQKSEFVTMLRQRTKAIVAGDQEAFARVSTRESTERFKSDPTPKDQVAAFAKMITPLYDKVKRVVVREHTATIIMPEGFSSSFVKEDGVWKCAD